MKYLKKLLLLILILILVQLSLISCSTLKSTSGETSSNMTVHFIDVGQGDSILINVNNKNLLIDAGPRDSREKLFSYLNSLKLKNLDYVIATHPHEDHIGNMFEVIKRYNIGKFYAPKVQASTGVFEKMVEELIIKKLKINIIKANTTSINLGNNTSVSILSPTKDNYGDNTNNYSPIIKITHGNNSFLFTGDAEKEAEKEALLNNIDISANVLKIGHHGSTTSTSTEFLNSVNPSIAVISVGSNNTYNHPNKQIIKLLEEKNISIFRTDKEGSIVIYSDGINLNKK